MQTQSENVEHASDSSQNQNAELAFIELTPEVSDALKNMKPEQREVLVHFIRETKLSAFSGPVPPPDVLQGYENIQTGFADRIFKLAEKQQDHRMACERMIVEESTSQTRRGQWMACFIAVLFLAGAIWLGLTDHEVLAGVISGGTLVSLVTVFATNRPAKKAEKSSEVQ